MYAQRKKLFQELETARESRVICYVTGDRRGLETQISSEVYDLFVNHLDTIGPVKRVSLYLYTRGGDTLAAWSVINLIRQFADELEIIVPSKCHSAGTLMCLGSNRIIMTKQATLGPIDPSVNNPLNPQIPGGAADAKAAVSVEQINGFIEMAREQCGLRWFGSHKTIVEILAKKVHPLVLGQVYRTKTQIQMLARRLLEHQVDDRAKKKAIIAFLCSESGSHDYTIHRREARDILGLKIEKPSEDLYVLIKKIYDNIEAELQLSLPFNPNSLLGQQNSATYQLRRCLLESTTGGSHYFVTEGQMVRQQLQPQPGVIKNIIQDNRQFEGWKHENA